MSNDSLLVPCPREGQRNSLLLGREFRKRGKGVCFPYLENSEVGKLGEVSGCILNSAVIRSRRVYKGSK